MFKLIWLFVGLGGLIGGYIPTLFGADEFSMLSILTAAIGSIIGIVIYVKLDLNDG